MIAFLDDVIKSLASRLASYAENQLLLALDLNSEVQKLKKTIDTINCVLRDAEERPGGIVAHTDQNWLSNLQDAVYDADDVFDEIVTIAKRKILMEGNAFKKEVKLCFSSSNQLFTSISLAQRVKSIRENLDQISKDQQNFGGTSHRTRQVSRKDTMYLSDNVVGREDEKTRIISMLLDSSVKETVCVIPIVGNGGLGKSTLARYVFNDEQVTANFKDLHLWVALPQDITLKGIIKKIVEASGEDPSNWDTEHLKFRLSELINGQKYLLVLDNMWNVDVPQWRDLESVLTHGAAHGSRILLTTRSHAIPKTMGTMDPFELQPLKPDKSWSLLESLVFGIEGCHDSDLKKIGLEILQMCYNVPLAIRALAGVLANDIRVDSWSRFQGDSLSNWALGNKDHDIMPILRLSYDNLGPSTLKSCFSYCSMFPNGYVFDKNNLVSLWIAQGFVEPLHKRQSLEDAGVEYLDKLLNTGLLRHVPDDESHRTCKLHDLMYELSCSVAIGQCQILSHTENNKIGSSVRHLSIGYMEDSSSENPFSLLSVKQLRTFLLVKSPWSNTYISKSLSENLETSLQGLRVLGLHGLAIEELPKSLGKLIHLRYLDLSDNGFERLPNSVTLLHNLQYLNLKNCQRLLELPKDMMTLVNLSHLILGGNTDSKSLSYIPSEPVKIGLSLRYIPSGLAKLTNLHTLSTFVVANEQNRLVKCISGNKSRYSHLRDLKSLTHLSGELTILIRGSYQNIGSDAGQANLKAKTNLKCLKLIWDRPYQRDEDELLLENLLPHNQISGLLIYKYGGKKLPTWTSANKVASCLQNLASVTIEDCTDIEHIPPFSRLRYLKFLRLKGLTSVEYLERSTIECETASSSPLSSSSFVFFPSLAKLVIDELRNLKGWIEHDEKHLSFPCALEVYILGCKKLESLPSFPNVEKLTLRHVENLQMLLKDATSSSSSRSLSKLECLDIDSMKYMVSWPENCLLKVSELKLDSGSGPLDFVEFEKGLECMTSLKSLKLWNCKGLTSYSRLPLQLCTLEKLKFTSCSDIPLLCDRDDSDQNAWKVLKSLRFLKIQIIEDMKVLPQGIRHLTALQSLEVSSCPRLEAIPDWIGDLCSLSRLAVINCPKITSLPDEMTNLTQLKQLLVRDCPKLEERCEKETGEDWHKIRHVPEIMKSSFGRR